MIPGHSESIELTRTKVVMANDTSIPLPPTVNSDIVNGDNTDVIVTSSNEDSVNGVDTDVIVTSSNVEVDFDDVFGSDPAWIDVPEEYLNIR